MPLYEYKCHSCGETFERIQKFVDEPLTLHEKCGGGPVERLISRSALKFKGTGWYVTDYASSGNGKSQEAKEGKKESSSQSESSGKSESSTKTESSGKSESSSKSESSGKSETSSKSESSGKSESKSASTQSSGSSDKKV